MDPVKSLLVKRRALVFPPKPGSERPEDARLADAVEVEALELGYLLSGRLRVALGKLAPQQLASVHKLIFGTLAGELGSGRQHLPLFRRFPQGVPENTFNMYVRRVLAYLFQEPEQPCVLCGVEREIYALDPCGHLVCGGCFDGSNYSGCPICNRKIHPSNPFLKPAPGRRADPDNPEQVRCKLLDLGTDLMAEAGDYCQQLLCRATPMSRTERKDLEILLVNTHGGVAGWLPRRIAVKETMAVVLGGLLKLRLDPAPVLPLFDQHLATATDVLRVMAVYSGGDAGLVERPKRFLSLPRAVRRRLLAVLERCELSYLAEDLMRHRAWWQRAAEMLHPFEHHARHPKAALCFAVLRRTRIDPRTELGRALLATARGSGTAVVEKGDRLVFRSWASHFETALASEDFDAVLDLIHQRPGELSRRLDHLLRLAVLSGTQRVAQLEEMFAHALGRITTPSLLVLGSHFRARTQPLAKRVFFPRGEVLLSWAMQDRRALLPADLCDRLSIVIEQELVRRAGACDRFPTAVIDAELEHLMVPFNQRTASRALIAVPRGSSIPLTEGKNLRLFLHWQQPDPLRVDLDLSAAFYDEHWKPVGQCDYTELTFAGGKAVHSGDFTSAPGPEGASEFVDLDIDALRAAGIRYAVMVVFAFNNVPFELLPRGYAGYMTRHDRFAEVFDARTVEQRFDLMGASRTCAPMVVDLKHRRIVWLDVHLTVSGTNHAVHRHSQGLGHLSSDVLQYFQSGSRPTLWQLACLHAASRCDRVLVRLEDGRQQVYRRADGESAHRFYRRLVRRASADEDLSAEVKGQDPCWAALYRGDLDLAAGSTVYALYWEMLSAESLQRVAASDIVAELAITSSCSS